MPNDPQEPWAEPVFKPTPAPEVGDRVAFAARYLEAVCPTVTLAAGNDGWLVGDAPQMRGVIVKRDEEWRDLVVVSWDRSGDGVPFQVRIGNLIRECDIDLDVQRWGDFQHARRMLAQERYVARRASRVGRHGWPPMPDTDRMTGRGCGEIDDGECMG